MPSKYRVAMVETPRQWLQHFRIRYAVYVEEFEFEEPNPERLEWNKFDLGGRSDAILLYKQGVEKPVGTMRLTQDSQLGFPLEEELAEMGVPTTWPAQLDRRKAIEGGRFAILKEHRGAGGMKWLIRATVPYVVRNGYTDIIGFMDAELWLLFFWWLKIPFLPIGELVQGLSEPLEHRGKLRVPIILNLATAASWLAQVEQDRFLFLTADLTNAERQQLLEQGQRLNGVFAAAYRQGQRFAKGARSILRQNRRAKKPLEA